jgi:hypothetical protein
MRRRLLISLLAAAALAAAGTTALPAHAAEAGWTIAPTPAPVGPTESLLRSVSCVSAQACMAVGFTDDGNPAVGDEAVDVGSLAESWNGSSWAQVPTPATAGANPELYSVSCASAVVCVAVGSTGGDPGENVTVLGYDAEATSRAIVEAWNGTEWTVQPNPAAALPASALGGVSCGSASFCIAVGASRAQAHERALAEVWNGTNWKLQTPPAVAGRGAHLQAVSCVPGSCQAVGSYLPPANARPPADVLPLTERWDGSRWSVQKASIKGRESGYGLSGVSCVSRSFCLAVGSTGRAGPTVAPAFAERWTGSRWTVVTSGLPKHGELHGVSCVTSAFCRAVGQLDDQPGPLSATAGPLVESWNGSRWSASTTPAIPAPPLTPEDPFPDPLDPALLGISCVAQIGCTAVGAQGANPVPLAQSEVGAPGAPPPEPPVPVVGRSADVRTISGVVTVQLPGTHTAVPLSSVTSVPMGTIIDATNGTVQLTSAKDGRGHVETGEFYSGAFRLTQNRSHAPRGGHAVEVTVLTLTGGTPVECPAAGARVSTVAKRRLRKLWGRDSGGNYATQNGDVSAGPRGTRWLIEETCTGTLVKVVQGLVAVENRHTHKTVLVRAGHSLLTPLGSVGA